MGSELPPIHVQCMYVFVSFLSQHPSAVIGKGCRIGPNVIIGPDVVIEDGKL